MRQNFVRTATGGWSAATAVAGLIWAAGGPGFPFDDSDRATRMGAVLTGLDPLATGLVVAALGVAGSVVAMLLPGRPRLRFAGWPAAAVLLLVIPDGRLLLAVGELLMLRGDRVEACAAAGGGLLTLGLTQRWGTRMLGLRVPPLLAVVPATIVAVILVGAGVTMWRALAQFEPSNWAAWAGNLVWLPWGVTLGLATWAYHRRHSRRVGRSSAHAT